MADKLTCSNLVVKVSALLRQHPTLRDNDPWLIAVFWVREAKSRGVDLEAQSAIEFLRSVRSGAYTSPESIRRCRQKAQELDASLRGSKYKTRQRKAKRVRGYYAAA